MYFWIFIAYNIHPPPPHCTFITFIPKGVPSPNIAIEKQAKTVVSRKQCFVFALVSVKIQIRIRIQLFTSMRIPIRIQGAKPMGIRIQILVRLCSHKKFDFDMKIYFKFGIIYSTNIL
jgi:hypothetical protein